MSADAWQKCPNCKYENNKKLTEAYGKVSFEEFEALKEELFDEDSINFREDYEIGVFDTDTHLLSIVYQGTCQVCDFEFKLNKNFDIFTGKEVAVVND
jgi:hypothetical protein